MTPEQACDSLLDTIASYADSSSRGRSKGENRPSELTHAVAFSGGIDSSVVALAVKTVFPDTALAVLGLSASLSKEQKQLAVRIADHIGIDLQMVETRESTIPAYVANEGMSCYYCKTSLYETMSAILLALREDSTAFMLYNGTNAEDVADPTRVGLKAAVEHHVHSPLISYTKADIRMIARHMGLPHWNIAAAPCLRSRLQLGVPATDDNLARIEEAERRIVAALRIPPDVNFRVRHLVDGTAMLEADTGFLDHVDLDLCRTCIAELGFHTVAKRPFMTGSVSGYRPPHPNG